MVSGALVTSRADNGHGRPLLGIKRRELSVWSQFPPSHGTIMIKAGLFVVLFAFVQVSLNRVFFRIDESR